MERFAEEIGTDSFRIRAKICNDRAKCRKMEARRRKAMKM